MPNHLLWRLATLGPLYRMDNFKDRVHWLILGVCKILLPTLVLVFSVRSETESYRHATDVHYRVKMGWTCLEYKKANETFLLLGDDRKSEPGALYSSLPSHEAIDDNVNFVKLMNSVTNYNAWLNRNGVGQDDQITTRQCCDQYRAMVAMNLKCLHKQGIRTSALSFSVAMFYPLIATIAGAALMSPIKSSKWLQERLLAKGSRPSVELTVDELIRQIQNSVQVFTNVVAFYFVVYKITLLSKALQTCLVTDNDCVPRYQSLQIRFLLGTAQATWASILWSFIPT